MYLKRVISGGQNGADLAGLRAAQECGLATGGWIPKGFRTLDGPRPEYKKLYGLIETSHRGYPYRTFLNVENSDATIQFATDWDSSGERCTRRAIREALKPSRRITLPAESEAVEIAEWMHRLRIRTLNVAGNSEQTSPGIGAQVEVILVRAFTLLRKMDQA